jgi:hypothetical protein
MTEWTLKSLTNPRTRRCYDSDISYSEEIFIVHFIRHFHMLADSKCSNKKGAHFGRLALPGVVGFDVRNIALDIRIHKSGYFPIPLRYNRPPFK